ncbi:class I adenylate-forming enzyme family protein [Phenylobacterium sp.]|uniref:class I adenylate-forming enzyme family protein n=1 Tax=Phenylobacterium sp. TaxID=1871053 RepID=UPI002FDFAC33
MTVAWPAADVAETLRRLTAPGAPFEMREAMVAGRRLRIYPTAASTMRQVFDASRRFGARDLLVYEGERISFDAHWRAATALGWVLHSRFGVRPGDRIAIAMRNLPEWSVCAWATLATGAVLVPLNAWEPGAVLARMLGDCGAKVLFADAERAARLAPHRSELAGLRMIVARDDAAAEPLEAIIGAPSTYGALTPEPLPDSGAGPDDDATIFYTSGTTGHAKGAVGTHRNLATNLVNIGFRAARAAVRRGQPPPAPPTTPRSQLLPLPFFHVTGFHSALVPAVANGATLVLMHRWDAERALDLIEEEQIGALTLVPSQVVQLLSSPTLSRRDLSSVDTVGYGGAAASPELAGAVRAAFPHAMPGQGYGATETSSLVAANSAEDLLHRPWSVGLPTPACDVRLVDDRGGDAAPGEPGELWVRGPNVVRGYWNAPEATAEAFVDGWYRTGDVATRDEEGFIRILDRAKDMLIRGGENIYCAEIEAALQAHPAVLEAAVVGLPDAVLGEVVGALVHLRRGHSLSAEALSAHVAPALAAHKRPVVIRFRDAPLPRNAAGKVLKRALKAELAAQQEPAA